MTGAIASASEVVPKGYRVLYEFKCAPDGNGPLGGVAVDAAGDIFGTTSQGGAIDYGAVYELKPSGQSYTESIVHSFDINDGYYPVAAPIVDQDGNIFVTAKQGGTYNQGTAMELSPSGSGYSVTALYSFGSGTDGQAPSAPFLEQGTTLYTTTQYGGANGQGTAVAFSASGLTETGLISFGGTIGAQPEAGMVADASGTLYGTTSTGGSTAYGTVYTIVPSNGFTSAELLFTFPGGSAGGGGPNSLLLDSSGDIFGASIVGGVGYNGDVYELTPGNSGYRETILHAFSGTPDGSHPYSGLALIDNLLYGTTGGGGTNSDGAIYRISASGSRYKVVHDFNSRNGGGPGFGTLTPSGGALYGAANGGGKNCGVVFRYVP